MWSARGSAAVMGRTNRRPVAPFSRAVHSLRTPAVTLRSAISTPEGKRRHVGRLFATIAERYDFVTRVVSYGRDQHWKRRLIALAAIGPRDRVLDLACGTGDLFFAAAARAGVAVGVDITHRMLELAGSRGRADTGVP